MSIEPVAGPAVASYASQLTEQKSSPLESFAAATPAVSLPRDTVSLTPGTERQAMGKINEHVEGRNTMAKTLQASVATLEQVAAALVPLKAELFKIIKNFPPFGIDSESRRDILRSYSAIRKEIDSMMVPPPPKSFYEQNSSALSPYFDKEGKLALQDLPVLPVDAPDSRVHDAAAAIDAKISSLNESPQVIAGLLQTR